MSNEQQNQILELRNAGYSVREIAAELDLSKSAVGQIVKERSESSVEPEPARDKAANTELGKLQMQLDHERQMRRFDVEESKAKLEQARLDLKAERMRQSTAEGESDDMGEVEEEKTARQIIREERLLEGFQRLSGEFLANCRDSTWSVGELDELADRAESLRGKIEKHCQVYDLDADGLAIYVYLDELGSLADKLKAGEESPKRTVEVDLTETEAEKLKARWDVDDFDQEFEQDQEDDEVEEEEQLPIRGKKALAGADQKSSSDNSFPLLLGAVIGGVYLLSKK